MPVDKPFWIIETPDEGLVVKELLLRRFPQLISALSNSLEEATPLNVVYPGNQNEYSDVVREIVMLLAPHNGSIDALSANELFEIVLRGLRRCFGEKPEMRRVQTAVDLLVGHTS